MICRFCRCEIPDDPANEPVCLDCARGAYGLLYTDDEEYLIDDPDDDPQELNFDDLSD